MKITIAAEPLAIHLDALELTQALVVTWTAHAQASMLAGRDPSGAPLPLNRAGEPYGVGSGTIARNWGHEDAHGSKTLAQASSWPYQAGGYVDPVMHLEAQGNSLVSVDGEADALISQVVEGYLDGVFS